MKALELAAGTPLVTRAGRGTRLTEAGQALTRHAAGILAGLTAAEEEIAAIAGLRAGRVRLVSFPSANAILVPSAVARLRTESPTVRVSLEEAEQPRSIEMLRSGECEVVLAFRYVDRPDRPESRTADGAHVGRAVGRIPDVGGTPGVGRVPDGSRIPGVGRTQDVGRTPEGSTGRTQDAGRRAPDVGGTPDGRGSGGRPGGAVGIASGGAPVPWTRSASSGETAGDDWGDLVVRPLHTDRWVGLVPADHPLSRVGRVVRMTEFAEERWIAGCPRCRRRVVEVCEEEGFTPRVDFVTDDGPAVAALVGAGLGVAMVSEWLLRSVRLEDVAVVGVDPEVRREVVALTLPELAHVPAVGGMLHQLEASARAARG